MPRVTRGKAIRLKCLDCCCGLQGEVTKCKIKDCPLWIYRMGTEVDENGEKIKHPNKARKKK